MSRAVQPKLSTPLVLGPLSTVQSCALLPTCVPALEATLTLRFKQFLWIHTELPSNSYLHSSERPPGALSPSYSSDYQRYISTVPHSSRGCAQNKQTDKPNDEDPRFTLQLPGPELRTRWNTAVDIRRT
ncbi:hypothetical protein IAQ61_007553 [Plenodomus lingam]|uniref:uncharacterized protein n=1 Tax=Leptosphaeria maculans TaxID=5022 RepID=UPI00332C9DE5|nr:hypothetical protein IAQ61_007553 [Plenodomus lingam]